MNRLSLRFKISISVGLIILLTSSIIVGFSSKAANKSFDAIQTNVYGFYTNPDNSEVISDIVGYDYNSYKPIVGGTIAQTKPMVENDEIIDDNISDDVDGEELILENTITITQDHSAAQTIGTLSNASAIESRFTYINLLNALFVSIIAMIVSYIIVGKILKPIITLDNTIRNVSENSLNIRVIENKGLNEVNRLQKSFNKMLDDLQNSFTRQKRFSTNVAHELKTPLTTINVGLQMLEIQENSLEDYQQVFEITKVNVDRLINIVNDLLVFTHNDENSILEKVNINDLINQIYATFSIEADKKSIKLLQNCSDSAIIETDKALIDRAISNIIENSIKYGKELGYVRVDVLDTQDYVTIEISDNGIGINNEELENIFEPFYCVDKSRSRKMGGAGIGLSLVKMICDKYHWQLLVDSVPNEGSKFKLVIKKKIISGG